MRRPSSARPTRALAVACMAGALLVAGCQARRASGTQCTYASECAESLQCAGGFCREACLTDRDCPPRTFCVPAGRMGLRVCLPPEASRLCAGPSDCPSGTRCGSDGTCRLSCGTDRECPGAMPRCRLPEGVCENPVLVGDDAGTADAGDGGDAATDATDATVDAPIDTPSDALPGDVTDVPDGSPSAMAASISVGHEHVCAVDTRRAPTCWGRNFFGQIGADPSHVDFWSPVTVMLLRTVTQVAAGGSMTCAMDETSAIHCWGGGSTTPTLVAAPPSRPVQLVVGAEHACVRTMDARVFCWGDNADGQLGTGTAGGSQPAPQQVTGLSGVTALAAGARHSCAITATAVVCWGANGFGQLGDGSVVARAAPRATSVAAGTPTSLVLGEWSSCAGGASSTYCWGRNDFGQLGDGTAVERHVPTLATIVGAPTALALGADHACAISGGRVECWGDNGAGELGSGVVGPPAYRSRTPVSGTALPTFVEIAAGGHTTCARGADGSVYCWGVNLAGQIGDGTSAGYTRALRAVSPIAGATTLALGGDLNGGFALYAGAMGRVFGMGHNSLGQLGDGTGAGRPTPVPVASTIMPAPVEFGAGESHACGRTMAGELSCWGYNNLGQLGVGGTTGLLMPGARAISDVRQFSVGAAHTCAVLNSGSAWCWGQNDDRQLGTAATGPSVDVPGLVQTTGVVEIAAGRWHTCARRAMDMQCWGANQTGQLGLGTTSVRVAMPSTVNRGSMPAATRIVVGDFHSCAVASDRSVWCWGGNELGELGLGTFDPATSPTRVGGIADVVELIAGARFTCARTGAGSVYCWGANRTGELGIGRVVAEFNTPQLVITDRNIAQLAAGPSSTGWCARWMDGTVRCTGVGPWTGLGDMDSPSRLRPTRVMGF